MAGVGEAAQIDVASAGERYGSGLLAVIPGAPGVLTGERAVGTGLQREDLPDFTGTVPARA